MKGVYVLMPLLFVFLSYYFENTINLHTADYLTLLLAPLWSLFLFVFSVVVVLLFSEQKPRSGYAKFLILTAWLVVVFLGFKTLGDFIRYPVHLETARSLQQTEFGEVTVTSFGAFYLEGFIGIRRQSLWPVDDNYFGRLPLS